MKTVAEAAGLLNVTERRVRQFIEEGQLPARKFGRDWMIEDADLETFASKERRTGRPPSGERE